MKYKILALTIVLVALMPRAQVGIIDDQGANVALQASVLAPTLAAAMPQPLNCGTSPHCVGLSWIAPATGLNPTGYQVERGTASGAEAVIASVAAPAVTFTDASVAGGATYFYVVSSIAGATISAPSNEVTTTIPGGAPPPTPPAITTQPVSQTAPLGSTATFSVVATGTAPLAYQWIIAGTTSTTCANAACAISEGAAGTYSVQAIVSNAAGSVTSATATLTVTASAATPSSLQLFTNANEGTALTALAIKGSANSAAAGPQFQIDNASPSPATIALTLGPGCPAYTFALQNNGSHPPSTPSLVTPVLVTPTLPAPGLAAGTYSCTLAISAPNQNGYSFPTVSLPITLTLTGAAPPPAPTLTPGACKWNSAHSLLTCTYGAANIPTTSAPGAATAAIGGASATDAVPAP